MRPSGRLLGVLVAVFLAGGAVGLSATGPGLAYAQPPPPPNPPPNPTDNDLQRSRDAIAQRAATVAALSTRLADLDERADELRRQLAGQQEHANQALVDLQGARSAAAAASAAAATARIETGAAGGAIDHAHDELDRFLAAQYQNGLDAGPLGLLTAANGPQDLLDRAAIANAIAAQQQQALAALERARVDKANADSRARATEAEAEAEAGRAQQAKSAADTAVATVASQAQAQAAQLAQVQAQRVEVNRQLDAAEANDVGLRDQRARFLTWQAQQRAAEEARQRAAQRAAAARLAPRASGGPRSPTRGSVGSVIDRAMSQLGVQYAWGGGTSAGPSRGVRDGGVADSFGDYRRVGFDCSGLMIYAFAGAGISLPHYSGYQYGAGRQVPVGQRKAGDMLFYSDGSSIVHVALYLGNGQMIEAPYSGSEVRITSVRAGGLMPNATRMF